MATVQRLKQRADFVRATRHGRKWATPSLVIQVVATPLAFRVDNTLRLGFTASKRVGGAVTRNRVKRRLRAAASMVFKDCVKSDYDYVLIGRAQTATRPFTALLKDLESALKRLDKYQKPLNENKQQDQKMSEHPNSGPKNSAENGTPTS